ncbi:hypothetical protein [Bacteroides timonensis]|uniref:hypothetical protein n=1 Tax=Bacteroides timonensis TaxID=1470345 RepID=UPI0005C53FD3|nr:hypothetical protein [Bacteroides timonensis]
MKKWFCLIIVVYGLIFVFLKSDHVKKDFNMLLLVDVESLARIESDGYENCITKSSPGKQEFQTCNNHGITYHVLVRETLTYSCDSKGMGTCLKGDIYTYYNCESVMIGQSNLTQPVFCTP